MPQRAYAMARTRVRISACHASLTVPSAPPSCLSARLSWKDEPTSALNTVEVRYTVN